MINHDTIQILKTFSGEELLLFEEFLNAPLHNKNSKVVQLFILLRKYHPGYSDENLSRENPNGIVIFFTTKPLRSLRKIFENKPSRL